MLRALSAIILCAALVGCGYLKRMTRQWGAAVSPPSYALTKETEPEKCRVVYGRVTTDSACRIPLVVAAFSRSYGKEEQVDAYRLASSGYYALYLPAGPYDICVFGDVDGDSVFTSDECVGSRSCDVPPVDDSSGGVVGSLDLAAGCAAPTTVAWKFSYRMRRESGGAQSRYYPPGAIRTLDDEIFDPDIGVLGLFNPAGFLEKAGLYFYALGERDMRTTPIILVHGAGGTPREFRSLVAAIDRSRFDIWLFYYPGGERLGKLADVFYEIFFSGNIIDLKHRKVIVVAHSMGGLVARAAINRYARERREDFVRLFISLATPYGGDDAAVSGVKNAPVVMPSWHDLATGSDFLASLHATPLPATCDFRLFFAFRNVKSVTFGASTDGTIELWSQLDSRAQAAARRVYGCNETHESILTGNDVLGQINGILAGY